jgi:acyl-CoA synthetase (AMP-forming)/AMP-acid ligase II
MAASVGANIVSLIERYAKEKPDQKALIWLAPEVLPHLKGFPDKMRHESITWLELNQRVARVAGGLLDLGIKPGDIVMVYLPMSLELYLSLLAIGRIGAIAAFLESWARDVHLQSCAKLMQPKAFISHKDLSNLNIPMKIMVGKEIPAGVHSFSEVETKEKKAEIQPVSDDTTALVTFTTGSSGIPKGANRTHSFLLAQHKALSQAFPYRPDDLDMTAFPVFLLNNLAGGISTVLTAIDLGNPGPEDVKILTGQILSAKPTCITLPPSLIWHIANFCKKANLQLLSLRRTITGGAPVGPEMIKAYKEVAPNSEFMILYGSTEAEPVAHIEGQQILDELSNIKEEQLGVCVGTPVKGIRTHVVKITREPIVLDKNGWVAWDVEPGEVGELLVSGPQVCKDYYNNPEAVKENKVKDGEIVWHRTGDLAYFDNKGRIWIVGRIHNAIRRKGVWYYPIGAELIIRKLNFVKQAAFVGIPDSELGEKTVAVYSTFERPENIDEHKQSVKEALEKNNIPVDQVVYMEAIPLDPRHHSKIDYGRLKQILQA